MDVVYYDEVVPGVVDDNMMDAMDVVDVNVVDVNM